MSNEKHSDAPPRPLAYRRREAAQALSVSIRTLDNYIAEGRLRTVPLGRRSGRGRLIPAAAIHEFLAAAEEIQKVAGR